MCISSSQAGDASDSEADLDDEIRALDDEAMHRLDGDDLQTAMSTVSLPAQHEDGDHHGDVSQVLESSPTETLPSQQGELSSSSQQIMADQTSQSGSQTDVLPRELIGEF